MYTDPPIGIHTPNPWGQYEATASSSVDAEPKARVILPKRKESGDYRARARRSSTPPPWAAPKKKLLTVAPQDIAPPCVTDQVIELVPLNREAAWCDRGTETRVPKGYDAISKDEHEMHVRSLNPPGVTPPIMVPPSEAPPIEYMPR